MYIRNSQERKDFSVLVGSDSKILSGLLLGADGAIAARSRWSNSSYIKYTNKNGCWNLPSISKRKYPKS